MDVDGYDSRGWTFLPITHHLFAFDKSLAVWKMTSVMKVSMKQRGTIEFLHVEKNCTCWYLSTFAKHLNRTVDVSKVRLWVMFLNSCDSYVLCCPCWYTFFFTSTTCKLLLICSSLPKCKANVGD